MINLLDMDIFIVFLIFHFSGYAYYEFYQMAFYAKAMVQELVVLFLQQLIQKKKRFLNFVLHHFVSSIKTIQIISSLIYLNQLNRLKLQFLLLFQKDQLKARVIQVHRYQLTRIFCHQESQSTASFPSSLDYQNQSNTFFLFWLTTFFIRTASKKFHCFLSIPYFLFEFERFHCLLIKPLSFYDPESILSHAGQLYHLSIRLKESQGQLSRSHQSTAFDLNEHIWINRCLREGGRQNSFWKVLYNSKWNICLQIGKKVLFPQRRQTIILTDNNNEKVMDGLNEQFVYKLKILIFGSRGSGKSSLVYTYVNNRAPTIHMMNQDLNFSIKKEEYSMENSIYECRLHMWEVANKVINNKSIKNDLFNKVGAYVFIYRDEKSLIQLKSQIWPLLDFKKIAVQPIYVILNDSGRERQNKVIDDFSEMVPHYKGQIYLNQFSLHDSSAVRNFFKNLVQRMMQICGSQPLENWVLRDRANKVVLRDQSRKLNEQFEKRYNQCC